MRWRNKQRMSATRSPRGPAPFYALALICGFAVLREGAETVLFVFSIVASAREGVPALLFGGLIGLVGGTALGMLLYYELCEFRSANSSPSRAG